MEALEELDVDVEGDAAAADGEAHPGNYENPSSSLLQDHYLDSTWRTDMGLPWSLDSTISEENKAAIEKMLLEEEYYLSSKSLPEKIWHELKESDKKCTKRLRSPTKSTSGSLKWTVEEKELFEQGLAKFGRRWTKIAMMIGSRNVLQVKSYARQYFKNKAKTDGLEKLEQQQCVNIPIPTSNEDNEGKRASWASTHLRGRADPNLNAVKIEKLSDDEEVNITDEMDELLSCASQQEPRKSEVLDIPKSPSGHSTWTEPLLESAGSAALLTARYIPQPEQNPVGKPGPAVSCSEDSGHGPNQLENQKYDRTGGSHGTDLFSSPELCGEQRDLRDNSILFHPSDQLEEENQMDAEELKPPDQEIEIDRNTILEEEKQAIPEFFVGRQAKTPERYLKIRNYILDQWEKIKPKYLNKTSVRPGLKNCGDVNCIGRIHTYLELIGAINFGCEQAVYNRSQSTDKMRPREGKDTIDAYQLVQRLQSMRTRRRRVRDPWGNWCDARDLEGQTFEHLSAEELAKRREEEKHKPPKASKAQRHSKSTFDPFQLIPCCSFTEEKPEPFQVTVAAEALLIMDLHAHVSMAEVIGLLGGKYSETDGIVEGRGPFGSACRERCGRPHSCHDLWRPLPVQVRAAVDRIELKSVLQHLCMSIHVCAAEPCNSLSTGLQCEMDPVSQTQASETLAARGYSIIGWYHSHPAFDPNPSIRDIDTQAKYQSYFSRGGSMFVGMIISPYNRNNALPYSQITCLVISDETSSNGSYRLPYKFEVQQMLEEPQWELVLEKARWIIAKYRMSHSCVPMGKIFHRDSDLTCLQKLMECMRKTLENVANSFIAEEFLAQLENIFLSAYNNVEWSDSMEENSMCSSDLPT
ncbi:deubiquitinase MYSM1 isoform X2 [Varanus komodoensis]|uniref:deubiquitinase MYSM1 isoform X2 n=1 Tax=Varanus komodoensis TaxID=61221 RepID=UPI001CF7CFD2|nr:deubiquitinase MYSM1 isoform X2 [Varanus komodoensis]